MESFGHYLPYGILAVAGILVLIGLCKGFSRGLGRQLIRTFTVLLALLICFFTVQALTPWLTSQIEGVSVGDFLDRYPSLRGTVWAMVPEPYCSVLLSLDAECAECVLAIPVATVLIPILFVVAFALLSFIFLLLSGFLSLLFGLRKKDVGLGSRVLGLLVGALQGAAVAVIVLMPLVGMLNLAGGAVDALIAERTPPVEEGIGDPADPPAEEDATDAIIDFYEAVLRPAEKSQIVAALSQYGGQSLYNSFTKLRLGDDDVELQDETKTAIYILSDLSGVIGTDLTRMTDDGKTRVRSAVDRLTDPYFGRIVAGAFRAAAGAVDAGIVEIPAEEPYLSIIEDALFLLREANVDTVKEDLSTLTDVWFILSDRGVFVAMAENADLVTETLTAKDENGNTVVSLIINTLNANERTKRLVAALTKLSVSIMADNLGLGEEAAEIYDKVKGGVNDVLAIDKNSYETEEAYVDAVAASLDGTLKDNGIELDPEIVDTMATYVAENYSDLDEITDEEINDVLLSYFDAYVKTLDAEK